MHRDLITTLFELVGLVLVCAGIGVFVAQFSFAGGLVVAGALLIGASMFISRQNFGE